MQNFDNAYICASYLSWAEPMRRRDCDLYLIEKLQHFRTPYSRSTKTISTILWNAANFPSKFKKFPFTCWSFLLLVEVSVLNTNLNSRILVYVLIFCVGIWPYNSSWTKLALMPPPYLSFQLSYSSMDSVNRGHKRWNVSR